LNVAGITVVIEHDDVASLYSRQTDPIFEVIVTKEMFPGLFKDPYASRVHRIAGFEDFGQGHSSNFRAMEVDGMVSLVSTAVDELCRWQSPLYRMPKAVALYAAAWDLASSRMTPPDAFAYSVTLEWWDSTANPLHDPPRLQLLATDAEPRTRRIADIGGVGG